MKRLFFLLLLPAVCSPLWAAAQPPSLSGHVLISLLEIGAAQNPNHFYLADVPKTDMAELVIENKPIFAPWFGWSPDGGRFAFLAPSRRGINDELWLGNPSNFDPSLRTPFLELGVTAVAAAWNPRFNIVAVATQSQAGRDGLYLLNANTEWIVFLREENFSTTPILDWSHDAFWIAYSTSEGALNIINTDSEAVRTLKAEGPPTPARFSSSVSGWAADDTFYVYTDELLQTAYVADGSGAPFSLAMPTDPASIKFIPQRKQLLTLENSTLKILPLATQNPREITLDTTAEIDPAFEMAGGNTVVLNTFVTKPEGTFAECMLLPLGETTPQPIPKVLGAPDLTHTRCTVLEGGNFLAIMATNARQSYENLPENWLYSLYIVPITLDGGAFITDRYAGFETAQLSFSESRQQVILLEDNELVVYNLSGERAKLATLAELGVTSGRVEFQFAWQP